MFSTLQVSRDREGLLVQIPTFHRVWIAVKKAINSLLSTCNNLYQAYDSNLSRIVFRDISKALIALITHFCSLKFKNLG